MSGTSFKWQFQGYDNGSEIYKTTEWRDLSEARSFSCENAYQKGIDSFSTNGGEYQFDIKNMIMYVIDFGFSSGDIPLKRVSF
tara:strand:+ start:620 stop:868 length:249 start_codon:yes stop_codon:yes gene_type:complete